MTAIASIPTKVKCSTEDKQRLTACVSDIKSWPLQNGLMLNENKTEILHFTSKCRPSNPILELCFDDTQVHCSTSARNLGVVLDNKLTLLTHVNNICKAASFALHKIGNIRPFLTKQTTQRLVQALVMSRIDFCNSLLYGLPESQITNCKECRILLPG